METRAHHVLIGFFTVATAIASMLFALWFGKMGVTNKYAYYDILFQEAVSGLAEGSAIEFNGIKVGEVTSLRLDRQDPRRVYARIRVEGYAPVRTDTQATLAPMGITGAWQIHLSSGDDPNSKPLLPKDKEVPVIVAMPSPLSKLLSSGGDMMTQVNDLVSRANRLFSEENISALNRTIANLEKASSALAGDGKNNNLGELIKQLDQTVRQTKAAFAGMERLMQTSNQLMDGHGRQILENANRSVQSFERSMKTLEAAVQGNRAAFDSGMQGVAEIGPAIEELRSTLRSVKEVTRKLEEQPTSYLFNSESVKEFKP